MSYKLIVYSLRILGIVLLIFGILLLVVGISEIQHPSDNIYTLSTKYVIAIVLGWACFLSSFLVHGFNIIVQAAAVYLNRKHIDGSKKKETDGMKA